MDETDTDSCGRSVMPSDFEPSFVVYFNRVSYKINDVRH